jgi:hypothetical protein
MEKLPLLVHGKPITDQGGEDNVGTEHRLLSSDHPERVKAILPRRSALKP